MKDEGDYIHKEIFLSIIQRIQGDINTGRIDSELFSKDRETSVIRSIGRGAINSSFLELYPDRKNDCVAIDGYAIPLEFTREQRLALVNHAIEAIKPVVSAIASTPRFSNNNYIEVLEIMGLSGGHIFEAKGNPYLVPGTTVLKNKLGIVDATELKRAERIMASIARNDFESDLEDNEKEFLQECYKKYGDRKSIVSAAKKSGAGNRACK